MASTFAVEGCASGTFLLVARIPYVVALLNVSVLSAGVVPGAAVLELLGAGHGLSIILLNIKRNIDCLGLDPDFDLLSIR